MFEDRTKLIIDKYNESIKLVKKLRAIVSPYNYGSEKYNSIFYDAIPRIADISSIEYHAHCALSNITKYNELHYLSRNLRTLPNPEKVTVKEHAKFINRITPDVFFYNAFYHEAYNRIRNNGKSKVTLKNNVYEDLKSYDSKMFLILNCIFLLDNPEPLTEEQRYKISEVLKDSKTFIFKSCKVTFYNNGRLIIRFSNPELFKRFKAKSDLVIKAITKVI